MATPRSSANYYRRQQSLTVRLLLALRRVWRRMDPKANWSEQYEEDGIGTQLVMLISAAQVAAARDTDTYMTDVLAELGLVDGPSPVLAPAGFSGVTGSGLPVGDVLGLAVPRAGQAFNAARQAAGGHMTAQIPGTFDVEQAAADALHEAEKFIDSLAATVMADTARAAEEAARAPYEEVTGWVRMVNPPCCSRCAILAGRFYAWNDGFERHPMCFPEGVVVSGPASEAATRRWFQGELVVLTTASGQDLSLTGNHPVLTRRGWVPAHLLQEGDEVVRSTRPEGATPLVVPDHHQMPALIEDVWRSLSMTGLRRVPAAPEDFHGDGQHGQVDVVRAHGPLGNWRVAPQTEKLREILLAGRGDLPIAFDLERAAALLNVGYTPEADSLVSRSRLLLPLLGRESLVPDSASLAQASSLDSSFGENSGDRGAGNAVLLGDGEFAGSAQVLADDLVDGQHLVAARWDAPGDPFSVETADGYAARGRDLFDRLAGQVELDRVVELRRGEWSGHVYSLTSSEGWHTANSLIVSNCDCRHIPASEAIAGDMTLDPDAYFESLSAEQQDKIFTKAGAEAIRHGADMNQVVNARRGMQRAQVFNRDLLVTSEGTTRRGLAYMRLSKGRASDRRTPGERYFRTTTVRLMPESIFEIADGDREEAQRLLRLHGFIL